MTDIEDQRLMDASELGKLIGRATKSVKVDIWRRPETLPPRFQIPGTKKIVFRVADVRAWMEALAELAAEERLKQSKFAKRVGFVPDEVSRPFHLGARYVGAAATEKLKSGEGA